MEYFAGLILIFGSRYGCYGWEIEYYAFSLIVICHEVLDRKKNICSIFPSEMGYRTDGIRQISTFLMFIYEFP